jgi:hypothetical protein
MIFLRASKSAKHVVKHAVKHAVKHVEKHIYIYIDVCMYFIYTSLSAQNDLLEGVKER